MSSSKSADSPPAADLTVSIGSNPPIDYYDSCHCHKGYVNTQDSASIYYEIHGLAPGGSLEQVQHLPKVVMIMGLACGCSAWRWQLQDLVQSHQLTPNFLGFGNSPMNPEQQNHQHYQQQQPHQQQQQQQRPQPAAQATQGSWLPAERGQQAQQQWQHQHDHIPVCQQQQMLVCIIDNRGVGRSSSPAGTAAYSTKIMAQDVLAVMDHLKWEKAHMLGFSMGGMIAQSLAVAAPSRVASLTLLSTSAGGWQIVPHSWSGLRTAFKMVTARTPEDAADATLHMHFRRRTLKAWVSHHAARRHELLRREYMTPSGAPPQPQHGFKGQLRACWRHRLTNKEARTITTAGFPVLVIHGRSDKLASASNAEALARRLAAPCVILPGAHFIVRECAGQINMLLSSLVLGRQHFTSILNGPYMDPSPMMQQAWRQVDVEMNGPWDESRKVAAAAAAVAAGGGLVACSSAAAGIVGVGVDGADRLKGSSRGKCV